MPSNKISFFTDIFKSSSSCGCNKSDIFHPKPKPKPKIEVSHNNAYPDETKMVSLCPKISDSVAVVQDSDNPYLDFRHSMVQMILERGISSIDELQELLNCFLKLNSPIHHEVIVEAFMEIWDGIISKSNNNTSRKD